MILFMPFTFVLLYQAFAVPIERLLWGNIRYSIFDPVLLFFFGGGVHLRQACITRVARWFWAKFCRYRKTESWNPTAHSVYEGDHNVLCWVTCENCSRSLEIRAGAPRIAWREAETCCVTYCTVTSRVAKALSSAFLPALFPALLPALSPALSPAFLPVLSPAFYGPRFFPALFPYLFPRFCLRLPPCFLPRFWPRLRPRFRWHLWTRSARQRKVFALKLKVDSLYQVIADYLPIKSAIFSLIDHSRLGCHRPSMFGSFKCSPMLCGFKKMKTDFSL